jgi:hypothetical protein
MADMKELVTVGTHERALATIRYLKANGFHQIGFWPKGELSTRVGILGGSGLPFPVLPPYRLGAHEPAGPFIITVPEDQIPQACHALSPPGADAEIERLIGEA